MKEFKGKTAVITGGTSGIGRAIADRCAREEMNIVLASIGKDTLAKAKSELEAIGATVLTVKTDVSKANDVEKLAQKTIERFGKVHLLFNNAGVTCFGSIWEHTQDDWEWLIGVNLWGVIHGVRVFTPIMLKQNNECHIINTASVAGLISPLHLGIYNVTKHGVIGLSETLYKELIEIGSKIKVSVLCPGMVDSRIMSAERNRPAKLSDTLSSISSEAAGTVSDFHRDFDEKNTMPTDTFVECVFEAIREEKLYVVSHLHTKSRIEERMNDILLERNPSVT